MAKTIKYRGITLLRVDAFDIETFNSAIDKERFEKLHEGFEFEYRIDHETGVQYAAVFLWFVVDTEHEGFVLSNNAMTYRDAVDLINHYL